MEIEIIVPRSHCKTTNMKLVAIIIDGIINELYYEKLNDVMVIRTNDDNVLAEVSFDNGMIRVCQGGDIRRYCLTYAETVISNLVAKYIGKN